MKYWWANQGQTHRHEISGGYLWAPKLDKTGRHRLAYDLMLQIDEGDCVFSYFNGMIRAVGVVMNRARSCKRPNFKFANQFWNEDGWLVDTEFRELVDGFDPKTMLESYRLLGPAMHGPINAMGRANMEYLYALPDNLGAQYLRSCRADLRKIEFEGLAERNIDLINDISDEQVSLIRSRADIGPTEIRALALARHGQGFFKREVAHFERNCRVTGVSELHHLRASHIKPWSQSSDLERLDGANGLLLSPHVDHLFDRGYISFRKDGTILKSAALSGELISRWSLDLNRSVGQFSRVQNEFLEYHRQVVFDA
jgi:putative restriction endonuclease